MPQRSTEGFRGASLLTVINPEAVELHRKPLRNEMEQRPDLIV